MSITEEDQRERSGSHYDDGKPSWLTDVRGLEDSYNADNSGYDSSNPASKAAKKNSSGEDGNDLQKRESSIGAGAPKSASAPLAKEKEADSLKAAAGAAGTEAKNSGANTRFARAGAALRSRQGRNSGIAGIVITGIVMMIATTAGGLDTEHYKNRIMEDGVGLGNRQIQKRRAKTYLKSLRTLSLGAPSANILCVNVKN